MSDNNLSNPVFDGDGPSASYAFARNEKIHQGASPEAAHQAGLAAHFAVFKNGDGIGSPGREGTNHFAAILKFEGREAYDREVRKAYKRDAAYARSLGLPEPARIS